MSIYRVRRLDDSGEALPSRFDTLRIDVNYGAGNVPAFRVQRSGLYYVKLFVTLATELTSLNFVYQKDLRSVYLFKSAPKEILWSGGIIYY